MKATCCPSNSLDHVFPDLPAPGFPRPRGFGSPLPFDLVRATDHESSVPARFLADSTTMPFEDEGSGPLTAAHVDEGEGVAGGRSASLPLIERTSRARFSISSAEGGGSSVSIMLREELVSRY